MPMRRGKSYGQISRFAQAVLHDDCQEGPEQGRVSHVDAPSIPIADTLATLGVAGSAFALPSETRDDLPDGSASRDMITSKAEKRSTAAFVPGTNAKTTMPPLDEAIIVECRDFQPGGIGFHGRGHQPGRGRYGYAVIKALEAVLDAADNNGARWPARCPRLPAFCITSEILPMAPCMATASAHCFSVKSTAWCRTTLCKSACMICSPSHRCDFRQPKQ